MVDFHIIGTYWDHAMGDFHILGCHAMGVFFFFFLRVTRFARYSVFWQLPGIGGVDNPMLEDEREASHPRMGQKSSVV